MLFSNMILIKLFSSEWSWAFFTLIRHFFLFNSLQASDNSTKTQSDDGEKENEVTLRGIRNPILGKNKG